MSSAERKTALGTVTDISKKIDIGTIIFGAAIGGQFGLSLAVFSGLTYILADELEKRQKK